jgi:hypothetical protein
MHIHMPIRLQPRILFSLLLLLGAGMACTLSRKPDPTSLESRLGVRLERAFDAEAQATTLWDNLLFGEPVSCGEILDSPPLFEITLEEQEKEPLSLPVNDHLNAALLSLQHSAQLWDQQCQSPDAKVSLNIIREAENDLDIARDHLSQAAEAWYVWQP